MAERAEAKQISAESTFAADLTTVEQLREAIGPIAEHAHQRLERDGRGARTVTVKLKKSDMSTLTRSATLPYATADAATLIATARRLLLDPLEIGPIRLLGVGFSGLSDVRQESLFPDLEQQEAELSDTHVPVPEPVPDAGGWRVGDDVTPPRVRPRLGTGRGPRRGDACGSRPAAAGRGRCAPSTSTLVDLVRANPVDSLDWPEYVDELASSAPAGDDVDHG